MKQTVVVRGVHSAFQKVAWKVEWLVDLMGWQWDVVMAENLVVGKAAQLEIHLVVKMVD